MEIIFMDSKSNEGEFVHYFITEGLQKIEDREANDCVRVHNSQSIRDPRRTNTTQRDKTINEAPTPRSVLLPDSVKMLGFPLNDGHLLFENAFIISIYYICLPSLVIKLGSLWPGRGSSLSLGIGVLWMDRR